MYYRILNLLYFKNNFNDYVTYNNIHCTLILPKQKKEKGELERRDGWMEGEKRKGRERGNREKIKHIKVNNNLPPQLEFANSML